MKQKRVLIITRGLPASGKSFYAETLIKKDPTFKRVERDCLREMLDCYSHNKEVEKLITTIVRQIIVSCFYQGFNVICSDTNLNEEHLKSLLLSIEDLNSLFDIEVKYLDFRSVPLSVCLERNSKRSGHKNVPANIIIEMFNKYIASN